jgi:hypothetical protein
MSRADRGATWGAVTAVLAWFAIGLQLLLVLDANLALGRTVLGTVVAFLSYFTITTNLLVAAGLTWRRLAPQTRAGRLFARPSICAATALYILVVAIVHAVMLRNLSHPQGWEKYADHLLHQVVPALYLVHWIIWAPRGYLLWRSALTWLIYPLLFLAYTLARGALIGRYPYPFMDVAKLGYAKVLINAAVLACVFALLGLAFVAADRALAQRSTRRRPIPTPMR